MDLWIVAAATGAGYIAKHWQQNLPSREKDDSSDSFEPAPHGQPQLAKVFRPIREQTYPLRRLAHKRVGKLDDVLGNNFPELIHPRSNDDGEAGDATTSNSHDYNSNLFSLDRSDVLPEGEQPQDLWGGYDRQPKLGDGRFKMMPHLYSLQPFGPFSPSESFLVGQFHRRHTGVEKDGVLRLYSLPPESAVRPLLITDGTRAVNRASGDFEMETKNQELPRAIRPNLPPRTMQNVEKPNSTRPSISGDRPTDRMMHSKGSSDGVLFFLGLIIGMMSSIVTSRTEMEKLNENLQQAQNLVEDLHEELEMKDQLTVKEIDWKPSSAESSERNGTPIESKQNVEKSEAMSKIEAELEAELERLELNMKMTSLENLSEFVEFDPDTEVDIAHQDLNLRKLAAQQHGALSNSDTDTSESTDDVPQTANYAVSPRELTQRLHEVIESRLEGRIIELEAALESTHRRLAALSGSMRRDSICEFERPRNNGSPTLVNERNGTEQPFIMYLPGEALGAYNEAYEEISGSNILVYGRTSGEEWTPMSRESSDDEEDEELRKRLVEQITRRQSKVQGHVLNASRNRPNDGYVEEKTAD